MTSKPSSRRRFLAAFLALTALLLAVACGGVMEAPAAEEPSYAPEAEEPAYEPGVTEPIPAAVATAILPPPEPMPVMPETRRLTLEFPPKMKAGVESDIVRLTLEVDDLGNITPAAQFEGNTVTGEAIEIPNLYATHTITAEARLDIAGMTVEPPGSTFQPLQQGKAVTFFWSIRPQDAGVYRGTVWLYLNFADRLSGEESRMALSAQIVEIEAVDFFGFSVSFARTSGVVGSILGFVIGLPFFDDAVKYLWGRRRSPGRRKK